MNKTLYRRIMPVTFHAQQKLKKLKLKTNRVQKKAEKENNV